MSLFPQLKSGAVLQYPTSRAICSRVRVLRFVDGSEQRFAVQKAFPRKWVVEYSGLDDQETNELETFVRGQAAIGERFAFEDPWDGSVQDNCRISGDAIECLYSGPDNNSIRLEITQEPD
jgi:hypothetical protein